MCVGGGGGGGVDVFEVPYITAKIKYLPTAVSFITASHTLTKRVLHSIVCVCVCVCVCVGGGG